MTGTTGSASSFAVTTSSKSSLATDSASPCTSTPDTPTEPTLPYSKVWWYTPTTITCDQYAHHVGMCGFLILRVTLEIKILLREWNIPEEVFRPSYVGGKPYTNPSTSLSRQFYVSTSETRLMYKYFADPS